MCHVTVKLSCDCEIVDGTGLHDLENKATVSEVKWEGHGGPPVSKTLPCCGESFKHLYKSLLTHLFIHRSVQFKIAKKTLSIGSVEVELDG